MTLNGDEYSHYYTTSDGLTVAQDTTGCFRYVTAYNGFIEVLSEIQANDPALRDDAEIALVEQLKSQDFSAVTIENHKAKRINKLSSTRPAKLGGFPTTGQPKGLVILVQFSDLTFQSAHDNDKFNRMMNEVGYNDDSYGSAYDYYYDQSGGQFQPQFDVYGPVTLENTYSYYGANDSSGDDENAHLMVVDACALLDDEIDFTEYDSDGDGLVDLVFILYAGYGENYGASSNTVWPHAWDLRSAGLTNIRHDGVQIGPYACSCELNGRSGTEITGIGTICHEFAHCLGLPDMYDTNGSSGGDGRSFGSYSMLDYGSYNGAKDGYSPCSFTAFERMYLGWLTPTELGDEYYENMTLGELNETNEAYVIYNPSNKNEYFVFENRQKTSWDTYLPGKGMMITHVYYNEYYWNLNLVNGYYGSEGAYLVPANNNYSAYTSESTKLYPTSSNDSFTNESTPASQFRNNTYTDKPIRDIRDSGGVIYFNYNDLTLSSPVALPATDITNDGFTANWEYVDYAESYTLTVTDLGTEAYSAPGRLLYEDFSNFTSGAETSPNNTDISSQLDEYMANEGWRGSKVYQAGGKCKLGTSSAIGYLVSPEIEMPELFSVSVEAKRYSTESGNSDATTLYIGVGRKTENGEGGEWLAYDEFPLTTTAETYTLSCDIGGEALCFEVGTLTKNRAIISQITLDEVSSKALAAQETTYTYTDIYDNYYQVTGLDMTHSYSYTVKAVAGDVESDESETITVGMSLSIEDTNANQAIVSVYDGQLEITTDTKCKVAIYTIDGICIVNKEINGYATFSLDKGIYILSLNGKSKKIMI